jgi:hypothetical protein
MKKEEMKTNNNKMIASLRQAVSGYSGLLSDISGLITQGPKAALRSGDLYVFRRRI